MAKLDFFVRYPHFFQVVAKVLGKDIEYLSTYTETESKMVRYHYGPWDQRYYHVLAYLEGKGAHTDNKRRQYHQFNSYGFGIQINY